ncbi:MAG: hypothetical protein JW836_05415 [Deltaproteobacteria bacterium]|nr:hypothetical protein [Deltaproteobacteria bacterium]
MTLELSQELYDAISNLGLPFLECHKLVEINKEIDTAAWYYNTKNKEEKILFNPVFLESLDATGCEIVLRHEILHKALYKGFSRGDLDHQILNIALDAVVNRVLSRSYPPDIFQAYCEGVYSRHPENIQNPLAIVWYGLDPNLIKDESLRNYYIKFWASKEDPSPLEVYYQLLEFSQDEKISVGGVPLPAKGRGEGPALSGRTLGGDGDKNSGEGGKESPCDTECEGGAEQTAGTDAGHEQASERGGQEEKEIDHSGWLRRIPVEDFKDLLPDKIGNKVLRGRPAGGSQGASGLEGWVKRMTLQAQEFDVRAIEEFLHRIESVDVLDRAAERIIHAVNRETRRLTYPLYPSRLGHVYILTGLSQRLCQYWNLMPSNRLPRLSIYVDVSPSMIGFREKEVFLIDRLKDLFPTTFYVFGSRVLEFSVSDFAKGKYPVAYSTDFNPVVEHLMGSDAECGVVFTDGFSHLNLENRLKFRRSGKRLFAVYFNDDVSRSKDGAHPVGSDLDGISEEVMQIDVFDKTHQIARRLAL